MSEADCFALTSRHEGLPIAILEAMACGLPVVATSVGGIGEVITHEHNGLLVPSDEADTFAHRLSDLIENSGLRTLLGERAREKVVKEFSWKRITREYEKIYCRLTRAHTKPNEKIVC
jgi:glycosyltransferase involved in cell wall biosynthesis